MLIKECSQRNLGDYEKFPGVHLNDHKKSAWMKPIGRAGGWIVAITFPPPPESRWNSRLANAPGSTRDQNLRLPLNSVASSVDSSLGMGLSLFETSVLSHSLNEFLPAMLLGQLFRTS